MTKTANITCEFEHELYIGQLAQQDTELANKTLGYGRIRANEFYKVAQEFRGEVLPESELDRLANLVKDSLCGKLKASLPRHLASNGEAKIVNISATELDYRDDIFVDPRSLRVCMVVNMIVLIEVALDDANEINHDKLFRLIADRNVEATWSGELARYAQGTFLYEIEIEYR